MENKVKIHFVWIKNFNCFNNQSFNFSSQYKFNYNPETNELILSEKNNEYIDNFFGDNIDVTAVVGENGTGKTTLLRFIQELRSGDLIETECVIVCENNSKFCAAEYRYNKENKIACIPLEIRNCENVDNSIVKRHISSPFNAQRFFAGDKIRFIYLTEMFNMTQYTAAIAGGDDLSFASLLHEQTEFAFEEEHVNNPVVKYIHRITDRQIAFLSNGREFVEQFNFNFPHEVIVSPSYDPNAFVKFYANTNGYDRKDDELIQIEAREYLNEFLNDDSLSLKKEYATAILMNVISSVSFIADTTVDEAKNLFDVLDYVKEMSGPKSAWKRVYELLERIRDINRHCDEQLNSGKKPEDTSYNYIAVKVSKYIEFMNYLENILCYKTTADKSQHAISEIKISTDDNLEKVAAFFNLYKECISFVDFLTFSFGLSSGETLLLNQFGKLMRLLKKDRENYYLSEEKNSDKPAQNAIIMLDEAEVSFHPEWQRKYFDAFLKFIKKNIADEGTHVQIILATHSPIILSDIPRQNTVFLKKDENNKTAVLEDNKETFAANIFSLYQDAFFMDESGIGAYAEKKLCKLIEKIHELPESGEDYKSQREEIIREISCIGDPYIRRKFVCEFKESVWKLTGSELEDEIKETEERLKILKQKRGVEE